MSRGELRAVVGEGRLAWIREQAEAYEISEADVLRRVIDFARGAGPTPPVVHQSSTRGGLRGESSPREGEVCGSGEGGGVSSIEEALELVPQSSGKPKRSRRTKRLVEPPAFTEFYDEIYPRKEKRLKALEAWLAAEKEGALPSLDELRAVVAQQIDERDWANSEKAQFIPHPASWINQRRWTDKPLRGAVQVQPKPDPAAELEAARQYALSRAKDAYEVAVNALTPGSDGWVLSSRTWLFDGLEALQSPEEFEARLTHAEGLLASLRAAGALPLAARPKDAAVGLIFPTCGGGPWQPRLTAEGWSVDMPTADRLAAAKYATRSLPATDPKALQRIGEQITRSHPSVAGMIPTTLTPLTVPGDILLIGGDPVRREKLGPSLLRDAFEKLFDPPPSRGNDSLVDEDRWEGAMGRVGKPDKDRNER